jgi:hypothetical protein
MSDSSSDRLACKVPQALAYVYSRDNEGEARQAKVLTNDEARRIAVNIARLPELLATGSRQNQQA